MVDEPRFQKLLNALRGNPGVLGCLVIERTGTVVSSTLPAEIDVAMIAALSTTLFSNEDVRLQRAKRGNLPQINLQTEQGILHFLEIDNHFVVFLTDKGRTIDLSGLIQSIEDQD